MCVARCSLSCGGCGSVPVCGNGSCDSSETCASCSLDCGECPTSCGEISTKGCCVGEALFVCEAGALQIENCPATAGLTCGWSLSQQRYLCGEQGHDPSLTWPRECPSTTQEDVQEDLSAQCQGVPFAGCCLGTSLWWCDWNGLHEMDCSDNPPPYDACGWNSAKGYYDCGGVGMDPSGAYGQYCPNIETDVKEDTVETPKCTVGELVSTDCADVTYRGCCSQAGVLYFCQDGKALCRLYCPGLPSPGNSCGWHISGGSGYYDCGGAGQDPSGLYPKTCTNLPIEPDVVPDVDAGSLCGPVPANGCCDGSVLRWCEQGQPREFDCLALQSDPVFGDYTNCGTNPLTSKADCLKTADPSPPVCETIVQPEPQNDLVEETQPHVDVEPVPDSLTDVLADALDLLLPDADSMGGDADNQSTEPDSDQPDNGIVIPTDTASQDTQPEEPKKDGGCSEAPLGTTPSPLILLFLMLAAWRIVVRRASGESKFI